jgi:hypothetical protein
MKVAIAEHFMESTDMHVPLPRFREAISITAQEEINMHKALVLEADKEAKIANKILSILERGIKSYTELLIDCHGIGNKDEVNGALEFLKETNQIEYCPEEDKDIT